MANSTALWLFASLCLVGTASAQPLPAASPAAPPPVRAHHGTAAHRHHRLARTAPIQPLAPPVAQVASTAGPAPMPNENVSQPSADRPAQVTNVAPSVFQLHYPPQGDGYVTGSSPQAMDDRNAAKATGVQVQVPLPQ